MSKRMELVGVAALLSTASLLGALVFQSANQPKEIDHDVLTRLDHPFDWKDGVVPKLQDPFANTINMGDKYELGDVPFDVDQLLAKANSVQDDIDVIMREGQNLLTGNPESDKPILDAMAKVDKTTKELQRSMELLNESREKLPRFNGGPTFDPQSHGFRFLTPYQPGSAGLIYDPWSSYDFRQDSTDEPKIHIRLDMDSIVTVAQPHTEY